MASFPPHVFAAVLERDLVIFDSEADRYLALPGAVDSTRDNAGGIRAALAPGAATALFGAGLLTANDEAPVISALVKPTGQHVDRRNIFSTDVVDMLRFGVAVIATAWTLRRAIGLLTFTAVRRDATAVIPKGMADAVARLSMVRLIVPSPRRCLPASLIAARFLRSLGQDVDIIFGVRSHPFAAHCWIERNGVVLDDDLDRVRAFTPIAVGKL